MTRTIAAFLAGLITAIATPALAELSANLREPSSLAVMDRILVVPIFSNVDAGFGGAVTRRKVDGLTVQALASVRAVNPDEPDKHVSVEKDLAGTCRTEFVQWATTCVLPDVKTAAALR